MDKKRCDSVVVILWPSLNIESLTKFRIYGYIDSCLAKNKRALPIDYWISNMVHTNSPILKYNM